MSKQRTDRLNSLLREVVTEVIKKDVRNPYVSEMTTVTRVDITKDLRHAKVYVSIMGTGTEKEDTLQALRSAAGFIAVNASQKVVMRFFPELTFVLDDSVDRQMRIETLLREIEIEKSSRPEEPDDHESSSK
ncbi:30S ribosome-binding factor RbfA [Parachlamydia sp. AcF125]|uniref:30S ribosome-binding factor RbfA n=1 Tax=Parachlamydia sp. AcF125 TaxID=2795736 RepID=UPI001BC8F622|nr:30S ribosome-binding factor RbfA [Parachlamydia sp. AcF125]MBS4168836.1 Ribosome-binding factor A [Parachlamydia sp. AcF125]